jgi:hypothetical protein
MFQHWHVLASHLEFAPKSALGFPETYRQGVKFHSVRFKEVAQKLARGSLSASGQHKLRLARR